MLRGAAQVNLGHPEGQSLPPQQAMPPAWGWLCLKEGEPSSISHRSPPASLARVCGGRLHPEGAILLVHTEAPVKELSTSAGPSKTTPGCPSQRHLLGQKETPVELPQQQSLEGWQLRPPRCPSLGKWMRKMWWILTTEYGAELEATIIPH